MSDYKELREALDEFDHGRITDKSMTWLRVSGPQDIERLLAERDTLKEQVSGWIKENGPGGWIDQMRKERDAWRERFRGYRYRPQDDCIEIQTVPMEKAE